MALEPDQHSSVGCIRTALIGVIASLLAVSLVVWWIWL